MNRNGYLKFIATLLLLAVIFFGILIVNALDRLQRADRDLARDLAALADRVAAAPAPGPAAPPETAGDSAGEVANRQYFDPQATPGGRMIMAAAADTQNMNRLINNDATVAEFHDICNVPLGSGDFAHPDRIRPLLAESWTISPDHREYRIKLRRNVKWHDFTDPVTGRVWKDREVTAEDFKFYLDVVRNPDVNCEPLRVYYQDLEGVEIISPYEFVVRWKKPLYGSLLQTLGLQPLPRHLYHAYDGPFDGKRFNDDHVRNRILIGCGPYKLDRWEKDVRVVFTRFDGYFGNRLGIRPPLDTLVFELIKHPNTRLQALLAGRLDRLPLTPEQWERRTGGPEFQDGRLVRHQYLTPLYTYIGYNLRNPLFADVRVRQALTMLVDREKILRDVYFGLGQIVTGPFFPESVYHDPSIRPWPYDVEAAKRKLAEAGWRDTDGDGILEKDGRKFSFTIMQVTASASQQKMLPLIKESMARAGIDLKIQPLEWSVCLQRLQTRSFEACTLGWQMPFEPDPYQVWHSSQADLEGSSNHIGYRNPEVDRLIEALRATFEPAERIRIARRIAHILHEEQPYTFLFAPNSLTALSGRYRNVRVFPVGIPTEIIWTPKAQQLSVPGL